MRYSKFISLLCVILFLPTGCSGEDSLENSEEEDRSENGKSKNSCDTEDGLHSASVDYYNPDTDYSATYHLEVEVENCEVTVIHFPNGGWLDDSHISPDELDSDGTVTLEDEKGRTFEVHIDN
jgi:hypothetical protein